MKPKEGTILTVAKGAARKALELSDETEDVVTFVEEVIKQAGMCLADTGDASSIKAGKVLWIRADRDLFRY